MATYADYLAAIDGKTFTAQYLYIAQSSAETSTTSGSVTNYSGSASSFITANNQSGTVQAVNTTTGTFNIGSNMFQIHGVSTDGNDLFFSPVGGGRLYLISNTGAAPTGTVTYATGNNYATPNPVCFAAGTRIATVHGEVAIETLAAGDMVLTDCGRALPVKWIGHRRVDCRRSPWPELICPIEIEAGALGDNIPARTMRLSPSHAILVEAGWIIDARELVNGSSIRQVAVDTIDYWHVELDEHAIIFADGLPAETFVDVGNRADFDNGGVRVVMHPRFVAEALDGYCAEKVQDRTIIGYYRDKYQRRAAARRAEEAMAA